MSEEENKQPKKRGRPAADASQQAPEPVVEQQYSPRTVRVTIRSMKQGDGLVYACSGFHVASEHRQFLPDGQRKILPGDVVELPSSVADKYLDTGYLEIAR